MIPAVEPIPPPIKRPLPPAPSASGQLTDRGVLAMAGAAAAGAWWHRPVPLVLALAVVAGAAASRRPNALIVGILVLASCLGARSHAGLAPVAPAAFTGSVTLVGDPVMTPYGTRADVRIGRKRVELDASGSAAGSVGSSLSGEQLLVRGRLGPPPPGASWLVPRHVVGRLRVTSAERIGAGGAPWRAANRFRRLIQRGAEAMPEPQRSLASGFILGDDRNQPPEIIDDFRGSGLTHLLVVSGQNVAFVLVLAKPLLQRTGWRGRWALTMGVLVAFGVVTRFEPSVLRAAAMAAVAVTAGAVGRPAGAVRTLGLAITALLLIDPLLVRSTGFQLSVGASLAIALLAARLSDLIPGPRLIAEAVGVTMAAQVGVAPVLIPLSGGLPVVSLIANPLAVPVAGLVTTWGLPAGVVAGLLGGRVASIVMLPVQLLITWVAAVARIGASLPLGSIGWLHLGALVVAGLIAARRPQSRPAAGALAAVALVLPGLALLRAPPVQQVEGITVRRGGGATVVVVGRMQPLAVLGALRTAGVRRVDVLVVDGGSPEEVAAAVRHRWPVGRVLDASTAAPVRIEVGALVVTVAPPNPPEVVAAPP